MLTASTVTTDSASQPLTLTLIQARRLMLTTLGLAKRPLRPAKKQDILQAIRGIHQCQIDSISVAARAHLNILFSRIGSFDPVWLDELLAEGELFEYFAHAVCFLPVEDYAIWRRDMIDGSRFNTGYRAWAEQHREGIEQIRQHLETFGAVRSSDFARTGERGDWWNWKAEKSYLEYLYYCGDVMIKARQGFQRVYELRERVFPDWSDDGLPSRAEMDKRKLLMAAEALGFGTLEWLADYFYLKTTPAKVALKELVAEGALVPMRVRGLDGLTFYYARSRQGLVTRAAAGLLTAKHATILSMFDPLVCNRERVRTLFSFTYQIEVYTPKHKRVDGYYVLPILLGDRVVGRVDLKAWRREGRLEAIKLILEPGVRPEEKLLLGLRQALTDYANWLGLSEIVVTATEPAELKPALERLLSGCT